MDVEYIEKPELDNPQMIAAWPGMGFLAKISADYMRRQIKATKFAEIKYFHNVLIYNKGQAELAPIRHKLYASKEHNLIICVGDAQPSIPEESLRLARKIAEMAKELGVKRIFTMAAYPNDFYEKPSVYGVFTNPESRDELTNLGVTILENEGAVNGLNGVMIGVAQSLGISGICLMGDITYANVPQHLASKAVLEVLVKLLGIEIDTNQLNIRAKKIDASIKKRLDIFEEDEDAPLPDEKRLGYIS
ncbi:PAC2 family protein [Candidatus Bathyarchaeota archaeon]|jgi:proteasome assembly chaperone (PAC2) family protein|nr:PAC2 family protein [Candidatus Bathyarchaeota archaeon]